MDSSEGGTAMGIKVIQIIQIYKIIKIKHNRTFNEIYFP